MFRTLAAALVTLTVGVGAVSAQSPRFPVAPGMTVRASVAGGKPVVGEVVSVEPGSLAVARAAGDTVVLAADALSGLEVAMGTKSNAGKGAVTGLLIGGVAGILLGAVAAGSDDGDDFYQPSGGEYVLGGLVGGMFWGAGIGALVGSASRSPRWTPAVLPVVKVNPGNGADGAGVAVGVRLKF